MAPSSCQSALHATMRACIGGEQARETDPNNTQEATRPMRSLKPGHPGIGEALRQRGGLAIV